MTGNEARPSEKAFPFATLRRFPDVEADNLLAHDATDRFILDLAADAIVSAGPGGVVVLGDRYGALTLGAAALGARGIRVHQDSFTGRRALDNNARSGVGSVPPGAYEHRELGADLVTGAKVVLLQLPKDLGQLAHWAELIARHADPSVQVFGGGRVKHMTRSMNQVFEEFFVDVRASLARQKSRVLLVSRPRTDFTGIDVPTEFYDKDLGMWVCSYPGVFAAGKVDIGTRFFIPFIETELATMRDRLDAPVVVDLGCGTGILTAATLKVAPQAHLLATDRSEAAVRSTAATLERNHFGMSDISDAVDVAAAMDAVEIRQDHGLSQQPDGSVDLILCNPPFHSEAAISTALSEQLFQDAGRALRPGGVMLTVFNSHLRHRAALQRLVGPTEQLGRNSKFTVTRSVKPLS